MLTSAIIACSAILLAQDAPPAMPDGGDILRGPGVPQEALKPDRAKKPADKPTEKMPKPVVEQQALFQALDAITLDESKRAKVNALRAEFIASVAAYEKEADGKRKEIFEKRRRTAEPGKPPSEEFKKAMEALEAKRPKLAELKAKLAGVLSAEEMEALRKAYEDALKRAREETTRREEEARRKKDEARKSGGDAKKPDDGNKSGAE